MRPKRTRKDANHAEIVRELRDDGYTVVDVADLPGDRLDLFVGQQGAPVVVICSAAGFRRWLAEQGAGPLWAQVEIKTGPGAPFTDDEIEHLERCGWDGEVWV